MKKVCYFLKKNIKMFKKLKKCRYPDDKKLLKLTNLAQSNIQQFNENSENIVPIKSDYVEKREIGRSAFGPLSLCTLKLQTCNF